MIKVPAAITKAQIPMAAALYGGSNHVAVTLGGTSFEAGTVMLVTFAGALQVDDGLYHGVYRFALVAPSDELPRVDFTCIPELEV